MKNKIKCETCMTFVPEDRSVTTIDGFICLDCLTKRMRRKGYFDEKVKCEYCEEDVPRQDILKTREGTFCSACYELASARAYLKIVGRKSRYGQSKTKVNPQAL